jgi:hypothetical protein
MSEPIEIPQETPKAKRKPRSLSAAPAPRVNISLLDSVYDYRNALRGHRFVPHRLTPTFFPGMSILQGLKAYQEENPDLKMFYGYDDVPVTLALDDVLAYEEAVLPLKNLEVQAVFTRENMYPTFEGLPNQETTFQSVLVSVRQTGTMFSLNFIKGSDFKKLTPFDEDDFLTSFREDDDFCDEHDNVYCSPEDFRRISSALDDNQYYYCGSDSFCQYVYHEGCRVSPLTFYAPRDTYFLTHFLQRLAYDGYANFFQDCFKPHKLNSAIAKI